MKKLLVFLACIAVSLVGLGLASADKPYGMAGCGLGSLVFKDDGFTQVFGATTNGTSGNQTFAITSGTSNCVKDGVVKADREQEAFVEMNLPNLKRDMAAGGGEYMTAFGTLLGCDEGAQDELATFAQQRYQAIFPNAETTAAQALYGFKIQASQHKPIASSCARL